MEVENASLRVCSSTHEQLCDGFMQRLSHVKFEYYFRTKDTFKVSLFAELFLKLKAIEEYLSHFNFNPSQYVNSKQKCDASPKRTFVECIHIYFLA